MYSGTQSNPLVMGGYLAEPRKTLPSLFGKDAIFGFEWLDDYPFALPNLMNALFLSVSCMVVFLFLEEVCPAPLLTDDIR